MNNTCGTCRHSSPNTPELECAKRPGWATWEGGACEDWAESNWQRYFGTPEKVWETLEFDKWIEPFNRWYYTGGKTGYQYGYLQEWLEADAI